MSYSDQDGDTIMQKASSTLDLSELMFWEDMEPIFERLEELFDKYASSLDELVDD